MLILLAAPQGRWRKRVVSALEREGYQVHVAAGALALREAREGCPSAPDAVVIGADAPEWEKLDWGAVAGLRVAAVIEDPQPPGLAARLSEQGVSVCLSRELPPAAAVTEISNLAYAARRARPRRALRVPAVLTFRDRRVDGWTEDLAVGGARVRAPARALRELAKGDALPLFLELDGSRVATTATVCWAKREDAWWGARVSLGLAFAPLDDAARGAVERALAAPAWSSLLAAYGRRSGA